MLASVFTRSARDALLWTVAAMAVLLVMAGVALPMYAEFGEGYLGLMEDMPEWLRVVYGESMGSVAGLVGMAMFTLVSPLVLLVYAIAMGTGAAVGEEEDGTLALLLANPISRGRVLLAKATVAIMGVLLIVVAVWLGIDVIAGLVGIDMEGQDTLAASVHLAALALLFGSLALAVSAWTGSSALGLGVAGITAVVSYVANTWLPIVEDLADVARLSPWQLYAGADALRSGVDPLLLAIAAGGRGGALRRQLRRSPSAGPAGLSMHSAPLTRVRPWQRVALMGPFSKAVADRLPTAVVAGGLMGLMGLVLGPMFVPMQDSIGEMMAMIPKEFTSFLGGADMATPAGFLNGEMYSMMAPAAVIWVAIASASKALAGEIEAGSMGLLAINPVSRRHLATDKALAMLVHVALASLLTGLGVWIGALVADLPVAASDVLAVSLHLALLGTAAGGLALLLSVITGRRMLSLSLAAGAAFLAYVVASFLPLSESLESLAGLSPWYHYNGSDPLSNGPDVVSAGILALLTAALLGASVWLFERRDIPG